MADNNKKGRNYISAAISGALIIWIVKTFWPRFIPLDTWGVWESTGGVMDWLTFAWPIFAWGIGVNIVFTFLRDDDHRDYAGFRYARFDGFDVWIKGILISLWAGVTEELAFRWLIFLSTIATIQLGNFLFFGFLGFGIAEWFHMHAWGPLAELTTFGKLSAHIFSGHGWAVGAAMLTANAFFRDGHKYQGIFGLVNSWFLGMYFFWIMFNCGLLAAIVVHFAYDFLVFTYASVYIGFRNFQADRRRRRNYEID